MLDIEGKVNKTFRNHLILSRYLTGKVMRRAEKMASRAVFTPSEGKNKKGKNAVMGQKCSYGAEMHIFYPHFCRKSKKNIQKEMGKVDEFQNILREKMQDKQDKNI